MRRLFWLGVGAALGAGATRKVNRAAARLRPSGLPGSVLDLGVALAQRVRDNRRGDGGAAPEATAAPPAGCGPGR